MGQCTGGACALSARPCEPAFESLPRGLEVERIASEAAQFALLSPDGARLLVGVDDSKSGMLVVKCFDTATRRLVFEQDMQTRFGGAALYSDGATLRLAATTVEGGGMQQTLVVSRWNVSETGLAWAGCLEGTRQFFSGQAGPICVSEDGSVVAYAVGTQSIMIYDTRKGDAALTELSPGEGFRAFALSRDGGRLASAGRECLVWNTGLATGGGGAVHTITPPKDHGSFSSVVFDPARVDGSVLATGCSGVVKVIDVGGEEAHTLLHFLFDNYAGERAPIVSLSYSGDGSLLAAGHEIDAKGTGEKGDPYCNFGVFDSKSGCCLAKRTSGLDLVLMARDGHSVYNVGSMDVKGVPGIEICDLTDEEVEVFINAEEQRKWERSQRWSISAPRYTMGDSRSRPTALPRN